MRRIQPLQRRQRRGVSVVEVSAASVVLICAFMLLAQLLYLIGRQERSAEARELAVQTVANELEAMLAEDWEALTIGEAQETKAPEEVRSLLSNLSLKRQVLAGEEAASKQLRVELTWRDSTGTLVSPVTLVAWKHRAEAAPEESRPGNGQMEEQP